MEPLHAPWRIQYILGPKEPTGDGSIFTRIARSSDDETNLVIARAKTCYAVLNSFPYAGGHLMVVPYKSARVEFAGRWSRMLVPTRTSRPFARPGRARASAPSGS